MAAVEVGLAVELVLPRPAHHLAPQDLAGDVALVCGANEAYAAVESTVLDFGVYPVEVRQGFHRLFEDGWTPALTVSQHCAHPPHPERPDLSRYSVLNGWTASHFIREEWYSMDALHRNAVGWEDDYTDPEGWCLVAQTTAHETGFHETTFYQFLSILKAGGFIPGAGTHRRGRVTCKGAFCCKEMGLCLGRANLTRAKDLHGHMRASTFPVVLELECVQLKKTSNTGFCARGNVGVLHPGVRIRKVHFSMSACNNSEPWAAPRCKPGGMKSSLVGHAPGGWGLGETGAGAGPTFHVVGRSPTYRFPRTPGTQPNAKASGCARTAVFSTALAVTSATAVAGSSCRRPAARSFSVPRRR